MKKILIIRFSSIGDIVLTSPVIRCLKQQAGAEIHFLVKKKFSSICENNPYIDKVICIEKNPNEVLEELKSQNYDTIIDLQHNLRSIILSMKLGVKTVRFDKLNISKWLMVRFKMNRLPDVHIVDRYMATVSFMNVKNDGKGLDYFIPENEKVGLDELPPSFKNGYIAVVCGATYFTKSIPEEKIIEIGKKTTKPILLLGGKLDAQKANRIQNILGSQSFNVCGTYTLNQSASLIQQADTVLTSDTGLMHIAAAFGKPIVSVWGNTVPQFGMSPYYSKNIPATYSNIMEVKGLWCRPCSKLGFQKCPQKHFNCMNMQNAELISEILEGKRLA